MGAWITGAPAAGLNVAAAALALAIAVALPASAVLITFPATFGYWRVGPASLNLSLADVALAFGIVAALPMVPWQSPLLQRMTKVATAYTLMLLVPVAFQPSTRSLVELMHRLYLVVGAVAVGAAISNTQRARAGLRVFIAASVVVALRALVDGVTHAKVGSLLPQPAYPWGIHKNAAGFLFASALIVLIAAPHELQLRRSVRSAAIATLFAGVAVCQSRGSAVTLILVLLLWVITREKGRLSPAVLAGAVLIGAMTVVSVNALFAPDERGSDYNSVNTRIATYDATMALWRDSEITGVGLKYWRDPALSGELAFGEPHNLAVSALGESGIIGLGALGVLVVGTLRCVRRRDDELAVIAYLVVIAKVVDSTLGIFWVAGTLTLPFLLVGLAAGAHGRAPEEIASEAAASSRPRSSSVRV